MEHHGIRFHPLTSSRRPAPVQTTGGTDGFTYELVLEDGTPADPAVRHRSAPTWHTGDTALIHPGFEYRIVGIEAAPDDGYGVWIVEPVPNRH